MRWPPPPDWPNQHASQRIYCKPHRWHVQMFGSGDTVLMLHGAGASTHTFRDLVPVLAEDYQVIAIDLPGQGFTQLGARHRSGVSGMTNDLIALIAQEGWHPAAIVGHSAGGALALRLSQRVTAPQGGPPTIIGINPALENFEGLAGLLFPALAKFLSAVPFTAQLFATATGTPERVEALIKSTGSQISPEGLSYYRKLIGNRDHADATLMMMAQWSLEDLLRDLPNITARTQFIVGDKDTTVPPDVALKAAARMPDATMVRIADKGHLVHEETPEEIGQLILEFLRQ